MASKFLSYFDKTTATQMVYLIQSYRAYNQVLVLAFKNDQLISKAGQFNISIEKQVNVKNAVPGISADKAILAALADRKLSTTDMPVVLDRKENGNKIIFSKMGIGKYYCPVDVGTGRKNRYGKVGMGSLYNTKNHFRLLVG